MTRYRDVAQVLTDERFANDWSAEMPKLPSLLKPVMDHMLHRDSPDHARLRTLVHNAFAPRVIGQLRERIQIVCDGLLDATVVGGQFELVTGYALPVPLTIISELLGIPEQDRKRFQSWTSSIVASLTNSSLDALSASPRIWLCFQYLRRLFRKRRADPSDDLITALVQAEDAGNTLSEDELLAMVLLLIVAGYETTVSLISGGALALMQFPEQLHRLREDPAVAESAIEELLRHTSPFDISTPRLAREELIIGSATIPRGALVLAVLGAANRDESHFSNPDLLDISRAPNRHLAFGLGAHFCLGAPLARLQSQVALTTLFRRAPNLRLAEMSGSPRWHKGLFLRGLEHMLVAI